MKALDQIEARTIVNAANTPGNATNSFIISQPGSYYLTSNFAGAVGKNGISIQASDVTLDLNGFTLTGPGTGGTGTTALRGVITSAAATNSCLRNGSARNWNVGVEASAAGMLVEKLRLYGNSIGLSVGNGSIVRDCLATGNATGFLCGERSQLANCIATENTGYGFDGLDFVSLLDCTASRNFGEAGINVLAGCSLVHCSSTRNLPSGNGINAGKSSSVINCNVSGNGSTGISAGPGVTVADCTVGNNFGIGILGAEHGIIRGCTVYGTNQHGIFVVSDSHIWGNTSDANNGCGICALGKGNQIDGNSCSANSSFGVSASDSLVTRNSARNNAQGNYLVDSNMITIKTAGVALPSNVSPWANFEY